MRIAALYDIHGNLPALDAVLAEDEVGRITAWAARELDQAQRDFLASFEPVVVLEADGLGLVLFCHGSPRSDTEIITALTPPARLDAMRAAGAPAVDEMLRESLVDPVAAEEVARFFEDRASAG